MITLEIKRGRGKLGLASLEQEGIETATMLDRAQTIGRYTQLYRAVQRIRDQCYVHEIRQEAALGLPV